MKAKQAYYTTSYSFSTASTSTAALQVWKDLSEHLTHTRLPMTLSELAATTRLTPAYIDAMFDEVYYQRFYGFRRFDTLDAWRQWAETNGVLYVPALHDAPKEPEESEEADLETAESAAQ